jgi:tetratricopeptide (TPR) repeat protein
MNSLFHKRPLAILVFVLFVSQYAMLQTSEVMKADSIIKLLNEGVKNHPPHQLIDLAKRTVRDKPEEALLLSNTAIEQLRNTEKHHLHSDALKLRADALFYLNHLPLSLLAYIESAETDLLSDKPRKDSILRRYGDAGYVYFSLGQFDKAIDYHSRALQMSIEKKDTIEIANNISNLGLSYNMIGDYTKAIDFFTQTLHLDQLTHNQANMSTSYNSIGMVYFAWGKFDKSLDFLEKALRMDEQNGEEDKVSIRLSNISKVYLALDRIEEAIKYLERALEIDRRLERKSRVAIRLQGLGLAYSLLLECETALGYFSEALEIYEALKMDYKIAGIQNQIGEVYFKTGRPAEAELFFREAYHLAKTTSLKPEEMDAVNNLYLLYKSQGDYARSLEYFEKYKALQDSLFTEKSASMITEFEVKYETGKKIQENELLLKENEFRKRTHRIAMITLAAFFIFSLTLLWALSLKRRSLKQSRQLHEKETELTSFKIETVEKHNHYLQEMLFAEEEIKKLQTKSLDRKKQELTSAAMLIANKNEVLEKLRGLADQIKAKADDACCETAKDIITEIDRQTDLENQWEQFKMHFESVEKSFFDNLRKANPRLTQNDMQLCAYIKLNLSTKDISRLMNIAPESVNTHRYRLRKKFDLDPGISLDEFVHGL